jgi:precorrin-6B methylase 2
MKSTLKKIIFGNGRRPFLVRCGLFRGLRLSIDPACETTLLLGLYEAETSALLRRAGRTMKSLIDVGAGYGELTAWALSQPNTERVMAFDPKPERWSVFRENMALNGFLDDTRLVPVADFFPGNVASEEMLLSLPEPVVMKLDVDGAEMVVLEAIGGVLRRRRFALLVETHSEELDSRCRKFLEDLGYKVTVISQAWWRKWIPEQRPIGFNRWLWAER